MKHPGKAFSLLWVGVVLVLAAGGTAAYGRDTDPPVATFDFAGLSSTSASARAIGENQFSVDLLPVSSSTQTVFRIRNTGTEPTSITEVFFHDLDAGTDNAVLKNLASMTGTGTRFFRSATEETIEGGTTLTPVFTSPKGLSVEANTQVTGINPGESLEIVANLQQNRSLSSVEEAIESGRLRVGVEAQGFTAGGTASFLNERINTVTPSVVVPAPAALLLGSLGVGLIGMLRRRRML